MRGLPNIVPSFKIPKFPYIYLFFLPFLVFVSNKFGIFWGKLAR